MSLSKVLSLALVAAVARANPALEGPTRVVPRNPPAPSAFPLGDACDNEWQYVNFNSDDDTDKVHLQKLHDVICSGEIRAISSHGLVSARDLLAPYRRYFAESDDENDFQTHVKDVLGLIAGTSSTDGPVGSVVKTFVVDNLDYGANDPNARDCTDEGVLAYTNTDQLDSREKIHFCELSWTRGGAGDVDCASLDPYPSTKMDSFSRIALNEILHYSSVGPKTSLAQQILDGKNADGLAASNPERVHGLLDPEQDDWPLPPETNADSYAWMSLDAWISHKCAADRNGNNWASHFTEDPPPYERDD